jgi:RecA-family ATPase
MWRPQRHPENGNALARKTRAFIHEGDFPKERRKRIAMTKHIETTKAVQDVDEVEWATDAPRSAAHRHSGTVQISSAASLRARTFMPLKYLVPGILAPGATALSANPKFGKSWFALDIAVAVSRGGFTLGDKQCSQGAALYLALEDNERRLQRRLDKIIGSMLRDWPKDLD